VLPGGRLTLEDAYAWSAFARVALHTNDIDARARVHSAEELEFLAAHVVGTSPETGGVTYTDLETAPTVVCVGFEPEEESPIVFLRLRKAARAGTRVLHVAAWASPAVVKTGGHLVRAVPGAEGAALAALDLPAGTVVLVGERAAAVPGLLSAVSALGARVAWIPRRAGERGAVEAGALPTLLPGGRAVADAGARTALEAAWRLEPGTLPSTPGRSTDEILAAALAGELGGLVVGGVELGDLPDPGLARRAVAAAGFVVSLELRRSEVTALADVVLPVAADANRDGSYLDWEGRPRPFRTTLDGSGALPDCRVLDTLAVEMDTDLFTQTPAAAAGELRRLGVAVTTAAAPTTAAPAARTPGAGQAVLATWRMLLDDGALQSGEPALAGTRRAAVARTSASTAARLGLVDGELLAVASEHGGTTLPLEVADVVDDVVWVPTGSATTGVLGVGHGSLVTVTGGHRSSTAAGGSR
jgi:NADH-quinone oxidoreductase subunit G